MKRAHSAGCVVLFALSAVTMAMPAPASWFVSASETAAALPILAGGLQSGRLRRPTRGGGATNTTGSCLLYTSPSPRD
eukprot:4322576-Alexandrium_andersonii.AAC.1